MDQLTSVWRSKENRVTSKDYAICFPSVDVIKISYLYIETHLTLGLKES
jgi:hypothetical protein